MSTPVTQTVASASEHAVQAHSRHLRWWVIGAFIVLALGLYVIGLAWVATHLETGVENSIQLSPALTRANDTVAPVTDDPVIGALVSGDAGAVEQGNPR